MKLSKGEERLLQRMKLAQHVCPRGAQIGVAVRLDQAGFIRPVGMGQTGIVYTSTSLGRAALSPREASGKGGAE